MAKKNEHTPKGQLSASRAPSNARLKKAVEGGVEDLQPVEALNELRARGAPGLSALLVDVALNHDDVDLRATAAQALGRDAAAKHRKTLLDVLEDDEPQVVRRAAEALGRIGGEAELERLRPLRPRDPVVKRAVETARTLLSYRTGSSGGRLSPTQESELLELRAAKSREIEVERVDEGALENLAAHLKREVPALPLANTGYVLDCGEAEYLLVLHRDLARRKRLGPVEKESAILGALLRRAEVDGSYYLEAHVLGHPGPGLSVRLFVMRTSGQISHAGLLTLGDDRASFTVSALNIRHTKPLAFEGSIGYEELDISMEQAQVALEKAPVQPTPKRPRMLRNPLK